MRLQRGSRRNRLATSPRARATVLGFALGLIALGAHPAAAAPTPPSAFFQFGLESAANPDGPGSLVFNPAAGHYQNELAATLLDHRHGKDAGRVALTRSGVTFAASGERDAAITPSVSYAGGQPKMRFGFVTTWLPIEGGERRRDYRVGLHSLSGPSLSLGFVADHLTQPHVAGSRLEREYTVGVALRPIGLMKGKSRAAASRFTLTTDARFTDRESNPEYRYGAEIEVVYGLAVRGLYFEKDRGFQIGLSLLGVLSGYHGQSLFDRDGGGLYRTHTASIHKEKDRTVLVPPEPGQRSR